MRRFADSDSRLNAASDVARCVDCGRPIRPESQRCRFHAAAIARLAWKRLREEIFDDRQGRITPGFGVIVLISDFMELAGGGLLPA
jgi:hypothetical protein